MARLSYTGSDSSLAKIDYPVRLSYLVRSLKFKVHITQNFSLAYSKELSK